MSVSAFWSISMRKCLPETFFKLAQNHARIHPPSHDFYFIIILDADDHFPSFHVRICCGSENLEIFIYFILHATIPIKG